ncbi:bifunctional acetaldehyde-CoA/alcohol dehydrogenase [bacterium]|nr:bifunctional acetaldehyde-CoA/alcohol dehydrogenase [bacterium]
MVVSVKSNDSAVDERANNLVRQARLAAAVFTQYSQEEVDKIVKAMTVAAIENAAMLALLAHEETRMGVTEDKILKNYVASEFFYNQIKHKKTVGIINEIPEANMVEISEPMGVILALAPVTNPTSTVIFKSIACAKTRNSVIFSPHLMAANSSNMAAKIVYEAALSAGAPKGFISWVEKSPRLRKETERMMVHPEVDLIFATGGTQMVKAAYSSGKPALGVGSGNTPVYVHKSAKVSSTAMDIIISKTFDNGTECPSEQSLVIDREIAEPLLSEFKRLGCYICSDEEVEKVTAVVIDPRTGGMNYRLVGQSANKVAEEAGLDVPEKTKIILCPMKGDIRHHKLAVEKLMPVLGYVIVDSVNEGINRALDINYAGGTGHTAGVFSEDDDVAERFAEAINAGRILVNSPTSIGGLGGVYNNLNTTLSFGCGTGGGNITSDNVGIKNLMNYKRVPRRKNFTYSFQTTKNIYVNPGSLDHLKGIEMKSAFVLTTTSAEKRGHLEMVLDRIPSDCRVSIYSGIGAEPDFEAIEKAVAAINAKGADTIIALGGGSVLDAAKIIRLLYDYPDADLKELSLNFFDFQDRMIEFPKHMKTKLVAIPTTSGTGSEVTPFAVVKDSKRHRKLSLVDESMLPEVAIIDANLTKTLPVEITRDTAFDALTHAIESLVSTFANDYTDGLALESMRLIFEALPEVLKDPENVVWRHKLHNAACLAGMAIGNASVGVNHALAHALGARFNIPHGRANSVFLLSTIAYNARIPSKFVAVSNYPVWIADKKYARAARFLGLIDSVDSKKDDPEAVKAAVDALLKAIADLARSTGQPMSVSELGVDLEEYKRAVPMMVAGTVEDMSIKTNPRYAMMDEFTQLFIESYPPREI